MFIGKHGVINAFKCVSLLFISYMIISGIILFNKEDNESSIQYETLNEEICSTPVFFISFAFVLGGYWNANNIQKFGVI